VIERADTFAGRAFADAEAALATIGFGDPRLPLPFVLALREGPHRQGGPEDSATPRAAGADDGALSADPSGTILETLDELRAGRTTTRQLAERAIAIAGETAELGTVVALDPEAVRAEADRLDAERATGVLRGPLHGIPFTVKDVIDVSGLPTRGGSLAYSDVPASDAAAVARLRSAGVLLLAKVATHEFALGVTTPQCRNPHDPERISGGSSGGSAIAVATGVGVASLGTDTRASLRVPASLCGVVGFKATFGRVPVGGIIPLSWTVDHVGPITRTVSDAAAVFNVLADEPFCSPRPPSGRTGVIGIVEEVFDDADPLVGAACERALGALEQAGWKVRSIKGPGTADLERANHLGLLITRSEAAAFHRANGTDLSLCIEEVRDQLFAGLTISATDYLDAQRQRDVLAERTLDAFGECDIVASPTTPIVAPLVAEYEKYLLRLSRNTIIWSLVGAPAVSVPCGAAEFGLPAGFQMAAAPWREQDLVDAGVALERALREA
jgi:aspartyl-tRNA(Asn)/glutamyl-tRNA(Gln) amidotransferase subunit A